MFPGKPFHVPSCSALLYTEPSICHIQSKPARFIFPGPESNFKQCDRRVGAVIYALVFGKVMVKSSPFSLDNSLQNSLNPRSISYLSLKNCRVSYQYSFVWYCYHLVISSWCYIFNHNTISCCFVNFKMLFNFSVILTL